MKKITSLLVLFLVLLAWNSNAQITTYPYVEDFESGDGGWTLDTPGLWELGTPANTIINSADTGVNAWVTSLTGNYADNEDSSVVSPVFDLSSLSAPSIEVSIWWDSENSFDGTVLQSSIDGGTSWQNVGDFGDPNNWFNDDTIGGGPGGQQIGWTGSGNDGNGDGSLGWVIARHALVGLEGESNVLLRFAFGSDGSVQDEGFAFDSINIFEVSCPEPSGVNVAGAIGTAADINWTPGGGETMWEVVVQPAGTGAPSGPGTSTASNNPYAATGLTDNTEYEVYVRSDCSGEFSSWVGPVNFITPCGAIVPEYNANMSINVPDDCWDESNDGEIADGPSGSGTSDWRDGTNYAFGDSNAINLFGNTDREWLLSPAFDLSAGGYQLEVNVAVTNWLDGFTDDTMGSDDEVLLLQSIDGGATWTTLTTWNAANEPAVGGTEYIEDLSGVTGTNVQFAIWASDGATNDTEDYDFHVGKFRVRIPPACPDPLNLTLDTFSDVEAFVSWTPGANQTSWEVAIQSPGTGIPAGPGDTTIDNPYTITGLTATTQYEVWVRGDCGAQGFSSWLGPLTFTTLNTPPPPPNGVVCASGSSSFIFTGEFDGVDGWTGNINGGDGTWEIPNDSGSGGTGADTAFSGASFMNYEASGDATDTASAVSPAVDLTTAEDGAELSFYMHAFGPDMGTLNVGVGTDPAGPFNTEFAWAGDLQTSGADPWVPIGVNLDAYLGQVIYIEFSHTGSGTGFEGDMSIDLVRVETCGSFCIAPSSILTSNATQTTVDIDWTANSGESAWEYVVVPLGTGEPTGSGTPATSTSVNATGLTGSTEYEVWVRADCGGGFFSLWAGPIPFFTAPQNNDPCSAITAVVNDGILCEDRTFGSIFQATASGIPEPSCGGTADDDVWFQFVATSEFHLIALANIAGSTTTDIDHSVYEGTCNNLTEISCVSGFDETSGVTPSLTIGQTYFIRIYSGGTDAEDTTFDLCITPYIAPENVECDLADDYCSGSDASDILYSYNTINVLPGFGSIDCLGTSPNPTFNLLRINTSGDILIEMVQNSAFDENDNPIGNELDVDFILWGPYAAGDVLCDATTGLGLASIVDCSYSAAPVENVTLLGAVQDEIYLLLITNFNQDAGVIQVRQTNVGDPGAGSTVADITVDLGPDIEFCGDDVQLVANSPSADRFEWYKDNIIIAGEEGSTLTVTESDSYQVIAYNDGCAAQALDEIIVTIGQEAIANPVADIITCDDASGDGFENFDLDIQTADILDTQDPTEFNVTYHLTINDAGQGLAALPLTDYINVSNPQQIWVRIEDVNVPGCFALTSFNIEVSGPTPTADSDTYAECDDNQDGIAAFDLPTRDVNILGGQNAADFTVTYYTSQADADAGTGAIDTTTLYNSPATTIFVRVESNLAFDCFSTTTLDLEVNTSPDSSFILNDLIYCDDASGDEVEPFELEDQTSTILGSQNPSDFNVTYHETLADAQAGTGALTSPYNNILNPQIIFVRVENATATLCSITDTFQLVIPGPRPNATADMYPECDNDYDGITAFDLPTRDANILDGQDPSIFDVTYYTSQADADAGIGAIDTSSLYNSGSATIYVRVESNVATNCFSTTTMELLVDPLPDTSFTTNFDYELCPGDGDSILVTATANNYDLSEVTISWYYEGGLLSGENSLELEVDEAGLYQIEVMFNQTQCMAERVDRPVIELETCVIPQGISPNNDGLNETFDLSSYNVSKLEIFNRHGVLVYSKKNYTNEWHGQTDDGDELPVGTYFYTMEYEDGKQRAAWVYIQREN